MNKVVKKDILFVISDCMQILKLPQDREIVDLKELSNHTIHSASIFQDKESIQIAILIYSLSKTLERSKKLPATTLTSILNSAKKALERDQLDNYHRHTKRLFDFIATMDTKLGLYIDEVIGHAEIKKGTQLYDKGISIARTSEIIGISQWDLMTYLGKTTMTNESSAVPVSQRIKFARSLFK